MVKLLKKLNKKLNNIFNSNNNAGPVKLFKLYGTPARPGLKGAALTIELSAYPSTVAALCFLHGAKLIKTESTQGFWKGEKEPAFLSYIETDEKTAEKIAGIIARNYSQECTALFSYSETGPDSLIAFKLSLNPEQRARELKKIGAYFPGFTIKKTPGKIDNIKKNIETPKHIAEIITDNSEKLNRFLKDTGTTVPVFDGSFKLVSPLK